MSPFKDDDAQARRRAQPGLGPAALKDQTGEYSTGGIGEYSAGGDSSTSPELRTIKKKKKWWQKLMRLLMRPLWRLRPLRIR
jgi:hypothetical protein